ncbi:TPA: hypothetical protein DEP96_04365 [Candidatus Uhrbacteria bacterium]|nr:hypothetical protein [Candidatus Uhrbacteria bacterium]
MNNHEHGEDCQHDHEHEARPGVPVHWVVLGVSFFLVVLAAMFLIGMALGRGAKLANNSAIIKETEGNITEEIVLGLEVTWLPVEQQTSEIINSAFRVWYDKQTAATDGAPPASSYAAKQLALATLDGVDYKLMAETVGIPGMGEEHVTYYLLVHDASFDADVKKSILLTKYVAYEPSFGVTGNFGQLDLAVDSESDLLTSGADVPALNYPIYNSAAFKETISSDLGDLTFMGPGVMLDTETQALAVAYSVVGQLNKPNDHRQLHLFNARTANENGTNLSGALNELFAIGDDGRLVWYHLNVPFYTPTNEKINSFTAVTWNDGTAATEQYTSAQAGGCGYLTQTNVVANPPSLVVAGFATNDHGIVIYEPTDFGEQSLTDDFTSWKVQNNDGTMEQFAAGHPFFYFKDVLGRYVKMTRTDVIPPGECGKPVIYLYPTKTTDISVQLSPVGGFTKTEPAYGNGWDVTASPDGSLVNQADGKSYPYLFWEGRGGFYAEPKYYDVVVRADVDQYLTSTLAKLGLNVKETADFKEFWLPRMQSANYYKIGWHGTSVMNALAPLHLSLAPQTLVRILMDYSELSSTMESNPMPSIVTPERKGFTVVEWGGVLR